MIELLLQADKAVKTGLLDQAERLYWQAVEKDPGNSIAVVGLAQVALARGDSSTARVFAAKALEVDPDNAAARRLMASTTEAANEQVTMPPADAAEVGDPAAAGDPAAGPTLRSIGRDPTTRSMSEAPTGSVPPADSGPATAPVPPPAADQGPRPSPSKRRGLFRRVLGRD